jgi:glycine oxidase
MTSSLGVDADVLIIGGGIHGCALARELALRGRQVTVLERSVPGAEASSAAGGILGPHLEASHGDSFLTLGRYSLSLYPEWVEEIEREAGQEVGFRQCGGMQLCFRPEGLESLRERALKMQRSGLPAEWLEPSECRQLEPQLGTVLGGIYFPEEAQVEPRLLMAALSVAARKAGAEFVCDTVLALEDDGQSVRCKSGLRRARDLVLAAGAWTTTLEGVGLQNTSVQPARGQMLKLDCSHPPAQAILFSERGYAVPRSDGTVLIGSTLEFVGFNKGVTLAGMQNILDTGVELLPCLAEARLDDSWSGFRPWTPDELPILGPGSRQHLWFSTGHYRNGILLAPGSARVLADSMSGVPPQVGLDPFSPKRFKRSEA